MTDAELKAREICLKYQELLFVNVTGEESDFIHKDSVECAKMAVDFILESSPSTVYWETYDDETPSAITFWSEIKECLSKIETK